MKPEVLSKLIHEIGKKLDNSPTSLERGNYVQGSISFGSLIIDLITGGGMPPGRWTTAWGPEASGKSTLVMHTVANAIRRNIPVIYCDHEASLDLTYARNLGIKTSDPKDKHKQNLLFNYYQPSSGESTYRTINRLLHELPNFEGSKEDVSGPSILFAIDSLAAMAPEGTIEDDEKNSMAVAARMHSDYIRRIKSQLGRKNASVLATNQLRLKPGMSFGDPRYEPGGESVKFYPDLKLMMQAVQKPFSERGRECRRINIKTTKNKQFVPFREVKETLVVAMGRGFERGFDGLGYLMLTGQVEEHKKSYIVKMEGDKHFNGKYSHDKLMVLCHSNEWRKFARKQLVSGVSFNLYFQHEGIDPAADIDPEDAGVDWEKKHGKKDKAKKGKKEDSE